MIQRVNRDRRAVAVSFLDAANVNYLKYRG